MSEELIAVRDLMHDSLITVHVTHGMQIN